MPSSNKRQRSLTTNKPHPLFKTIKQYLESLPRNETDSENEIIHLSYTRNKDNIEILVTRQVSSASSTTSRSEHSFKFKQEPIASSTIVKEEPRSNPITNYIQPIITPLQSVPSTPNAVVQDHFRPGSLHNPLASPPSTPPPSSSLGNRSMNKLSPKSPVIANPALVYGSISSMTSPPPEPKTISLSSPPLKRRANPLFSAAPKYCTRCHRSTHSTENCFARTNFYGEILPPVMEEPSIMAKMASTSTTGNECFRCGRFGHYGYECYATSDSRGWAFSDEDDCDDYIDGNWDDDY